ncbi:MAG TPA: OmpA family protein [Saprospiraceae bacterium]|nr:OmpA family protein [Saprospiraceae bacterium]
MADKQNPTKKPKVDTARTTKVQGTDPRENKILKSLDKDKIKVGQSIRIEKLFFKSDSSNIDSSSFQVLQEVYDFLVTNPKVKVEIGGHTNGQPPHEYCDKLSASRARSVRDFIIGKGISPDRVTFRGYGKRYPIATNDTKAGRALNQRVEIKIISLG